MKVFSVRTPVIVQPISLARLPGFKRKPLALQDTVSRWRKTVSLLDVTETVRSKASVKLEWIIFYYTVANKDVSVTAQYFSITNKTVYKWMNRFELSNQNVNSLIEQSRRPNSVRQWTVTLLEETRIKKLRLKHMVWGSNKLRKLYKDEYGETISSWKIGLVIRKHQLYPDQVKQDKISSNKAKSSNNKLKLKITQFTYTNKLWHLIHVDGITIYWQGLKRYLFTAVDHAGKVGYARMYTNKSSHNTKDFLIRLHYLVNDKIPNIQTDNGSEFYGAFDQALTDLETLHWFSRPYTPTDNAEVERFNGTLKHEWMEWGHYTNDTIQFNKELTEWLVEYNSVRPHESLDYLNPLEFADQSLLQSNQPTTHKLLPMYSTSTDY